MNVEHAPLFEPLVIRSTKVKNRIAFAPTGMGTADQDGRVTDQVLCHYVARAKGGAGLIIVEHTMCSDTYGLPEGFLGAHNDGCLAGLETLARTIRACDAVGVVQLSLGLGRFGIPAVAPSPTPFHIPKGSTARGFKRFEGRTGPVPHELTIPEIEDLENQFVKAARRLSKANFHGMEIHGANGYILASFFSPLTNHRTDRYGGSLENRTRLAINLIQRSRAAVRDNFIIGIRISGDEHVEGGLTNKDFAEIAAILEEAGIDYVHISSGTKEAWKYTYPEVDLAVLPESIGFKKAVRRIPVICPGFHDPRTAAEAVGAGKVDVVSISRGLLADPQWPNKVKEGRVEDIQLCVRCNVCVTSLLQGFHARCAVNPAVGRERFMPEYAVPPPRRAKGRNI